MDDEAEGIHERHLDDELENIFDPYRNKPKDEKPLWDEFVVIPPEDTAKEEGALLHFGTKFAKYLSVLVFAGAVFVGSLVVKSTLLVVANAYSEEYKTDKSCPKDKDNQPQYLHYMTMLMLMTMLCFSEGLTFVYCLYKIIMRKERPLTWTVCLWGAVPEVLSAIGLTFLVVEVIPKIDATLAVLLLSLVAFVPACINVHAKYVSINRNRERLTNITIRRRRIRDFAFSILCLILHPVGYGLVCWQLMQKVDTGTIVIAGVSLFLMSFRYWENFVTCDFVFTEKIKIEIHEIQKGLDRRRFKTSFIYSILRMGVIVGCCFFIHFVLNGYTDIVQQKGRNEIKFKHYVPTASCSRLIEPLWNAVITNCFGGLAVFYFGRVACQTIVQVQSYTFPIALVSPVMASLTAAYSMNNEQGKTLMTFFFSYGRPSHLEPNAWLEYVGWNTVYSLPDTGHWQMAIIVVVGLIAGWLSLILMTFYLWSPNQDRLSRTEVIFVKSIYGGVTITEDMMLNRRAYQSTYTTRKNQEEETERVAMVRKMTMTARSSVSSRKQSRRLTVSAQRKFVPQVFLCATMWHETEQEMTQLITSIMRLDKDQGKRRPNSRTDRDYYNFQVHVLFDDAMDITAEGSRPNKFVNLLLDLIPVAANKVDLGTGDDMTPPVIYPTPYGGRLEFVLPHGNLFHVHLKDKAKIRHRKRWSQCMYMYYILGYLQQTKKAYKKEDVFILALDGDVDFQPRALLLLLDRMKRNPDVGAACGRIHPEGSGPVVWFQKFEYAVGHWLQKTAEHVLGCVLCSPGCFSLFRGVALTDINVVNMYTTKATEAIHYIQWDQGEDRWLCTLLLKQGWRIEYSAASDSFTFAPEDFKEFFNQRRRWGPSTMANVFDILMNAGLTVRNNEYISWGYIAYQMGLMASSILGPATVVLVVAGGFQYVFGVPLLTALLIAIIPVIIFIILCYTTTPDFQLAVAGILTIVYALVMMAVLVGIAGQMAQSLLNPNSIFMIAMIVMYSFTGLIHPTEMLCLMHGVLYYLCVPSAFILLMVYSLCNMNNVSWGTREVKKPVLDQDAQQEALKQLADKNLKKGKKTMQLGPSVYDAQPSATDGYYSCGLGNLCQCALCINPAPAPPPPPRQAYQRIPQEDPSMARRTSYRTSMMHRPVTGVDKSQMIRKYSMAKSKFMGESDRNPNLLEKSLSRKISLQELRYMMANNDDIDDVRSLRKSVKIRRDTMRKLTRTHKDSLHISKDLPVDEISKLAGPTGIDSDDEEDVTEERLQDEEEEGLYWIVDGPMTDGIIEYLDDNEHTFWKDMIGKYLLPLEENKQDQERIKSDLIDLRNKMTGAYFLINALWIVLTVSLTLAIDDINITYYDSKGTEIVLQPLSFLFLIFFLTILCIQFTTMLVHRWSTFIHLMSTTTFKWTNDEYGKQDIDEQVGNNVGNHQPKQKKKKKNKKHVDIEVGEIASTSHDNDAYDGGNNFSYQPSQKNTFGASVTVNEHVLTNSDESDIEDQVYDDLDVPAPGGSLRWRAGLAQSLSDAQSSHVQNDATYDVIGRDRQPSINSFDLKESTAQKQGSQGADRAFDNIIIQQPKKINETSKSTVF